VTFTDIPCKGDILTISFYCCMYAYEFLFIFLMLAVLCSQNMELFGLL